MRTQLSLAAIAALALASTTFTGPAQSHDHKVAVPTAELKSAIAAPTRTPANVTRDRYRNPEATLSFFGVMPSQTVVEIWPGGGWYTEILAPYLKQGGGTLYAAAPWPERLKNIQAMQERDPATYGAVKLAGFPASEGAPRVPDASVDTVLTFRNVHNWKMGAQDISATAFAQMFAMLKPGGTLGIVDHRLPEGADSTREKSSGYLKVSTVRAMAEAAGFEFVAASEVNANPKDTADWEKGVWTLPPVYSLKDVDRTKYEAIGESDRMTLKFRKPGGHHHH